MAKAKPIEELNCEGDAAEMAKLILRQRLSEMLEFKESAIEPENVDAIHDMRVASRRFRSLLRDFGKVIGKKELKPVAKRAKQLADALGDIRDVDVAIEALQKLVTASPDNETSEFLANLIQSHQNDRENNLEKLSEQIETLSPELTKKFEDIRNKDSGSDDKELNFRALGRKILSKALAKFQEREEALLNPLAVEGLHKLRITAKRFRYSLQLFNPCYDGELKAIAKRLSKIQTSLGDVHDRDVWIENVNARTNKDVNAQEVTWLVAEWTNERTAAYNAALENWNQWKAENIPGKLAEILETRNDFHVNETQENAENDQVDNTE